MDKKYAKLRYHGEGGSLFGLAIVNGLLTIITLGIYSFWAKNKIREFHYSHTEMDGDRFAYHGTGSELLVGALKAGAIIFVLVLGLGLTLNMVGGQQASPLVQVGVTVAFYGVIALLSIFAVNSTRRYRLSRSSWRGVRFSYHGKFGEYFGLILGGGLLSIITLGFYSPVFENKRRAFFVNNARFGNEPFIYKGEAAPLFKEYLKTLLLLIPTLGLYSVWYAAFKHRHFWNHTEMRGARFKSSVAGKDLLVLALTNALLVIFTLGIGTPWAICRMHRYWCDNILLVGTVDWASIQQQAQVASATGEGLAEGLDIDVGIGM